MTAPKNAPRIREGIKAYLLRNGWIPRGHLWHHPAPHLRRVDGMPVFTAEALAAQRAMDRRAM